MTTIFFHRKTTKSEARLSEKHLSVLNPNNFCFCPFRGYRSSWCYWIPAKWKSNAPFFWSLMASRVVISFVFLLFCGAEVALNTFWLKKRCLMGSCVSTGNKTKTEGSVRPSLFWVGGLRVVLKFRLQEWLMTDSAIFHQKKGPI